MTATSVQRLRAAVLAVGTDDLRDAIRGIDEATVRALPARARPLVSQLRRATAPADLLRKIPDVAVVSLLADTLSDASLAAVRDALGDAADDPTRDQLVTAVDTVLEDFHVAIVRVMLATVAVGDAEAAGLCDDLLEHDERFALANTPNAPTSVTRQPKPPQSDDVLARRRERKEAQREARQRAAEARAPRSKRKSPPTVVTGEGDRVADVPMVSRRQPTLIAEEARAFDVDDPLVGAVVIAVVPFDDPTTEIGAKARPCVVVGTAPDELLVRPGYSEGGLQSRRWQSYALRDWAGAGLTKATWIEDDTRVIHRADASEPVGRLSDDDWNALW